MKFKDFAQGILSRNSQPEMLQSQVGGTGNSLQEVTMFDLEIELQNDGEIEMRYMARAGRRHRSHN